MDVDFILGAIFGSIVASIIAWWNMDDLHRRHMRQHHKSLALIKKLARMLEKKPDDADWWKQN